MSARSRLVLETLVALAGVFSITVAYAAVHPVVASTGVVPLVIAYELLFYVLLVAFVVALGKLRKRPAAEALGFEWRPFRRQLLIGAAIFAITISFIVVPLLFGADRTELLSFKARNLWVLLYYAVRALFFVGFGEELVWRGYFLDRAREITGSGIWAVVLSSLLFGLWHYPIGQNVLQVLATAGLGMLYGFARLKVRGCSTLATGLAHGLHDAAIVVLSYFLL